MDDEKRGFRELIVNALEEWFGPCAARLASRWHGGKFILQPENETLAAKEIDVEVFFHKIVMVRESLRVLEQRINSHPKLNDEDRLQLQQYVSRCYGTLTTFNVLFQDERDKFIGQKS